jgi:hypothetical protein
MPRPPRWEDLTPRERRAYTRAVRVVGRVRGGEPYRQALRAERTTDATVRRYAGAVLYRTRSGDVRARARDSLVRLLLVPTPDGPRRLPIRGSAEASILGRYWAAVKRYLDTGNDRDLRRLERQRRTVADVAGIRHRLPFDRATLRRLAQRGRLDLEDFGS